MRHGLRSRRLGRSRSERAALLRALARAVIRYERIQTTLPKAKEAQRATERLITQAKAGTLAARRRVEAWLQDPEAVRTLWSQIAPRCQSRAGGYTRIVHAGRRHGDGAAMAVLELVERKPEAPPKPARRRETPPPTPKLPLPPKPPAGEPPPRPKRPGGFLKGLRRLFRKSRQDRQGD